MAETTIVLPDVSLLDAVEEVLRSLSLPPGTEFRVEPAMDYPGQRVAVDLFATTDQALAQAVEMVREALFQRFRIPTHTSDELDRRIQRHQSP